MGELPDERMREANPGVDMYELPRWRCWLLRVVPCNRLTWRLVERLQGRGR